MNIFAIKFPNTRSQGKFSCDCRWYRYVGHDNLQFSIGSTDCGKRAKIFNSSRNWMTASDGIF